MNEQSARKYLKSLIINFCWILPVSFLVVKGFIYLVSSFDPKSASFYQSATIWIVLGVALYATISHTPTPDDEAKQEDAYQSNCLKRCPRCKALPNGYYEESPEFGYLFFCRCPSCGLEGEKMATIKDAKIMWNGIGSIITPSHVLKRPEQEAKQVKLWETIEQLNIRKR